MKKERQQVFNITKNLYDEMQTYYQKNNLVEQQKLDTFIEEFVQPLYPSKPVQNIINLKASDIITKHQLGKSHRKQIYNRKNSIAEFTDFTDLRFNSQSSSEISDKSKIIYPYVIRRYKMKQLCFKLGTGNFFCWKTSPPDQVYQNMGLSTCLYLKFIKHLIYTLLFTLPLVIFLLVSFYCVALDNQFAPDTNYQKFIFSFSISTLSLQGVKCKYQNVGINNNKIDTQLVCPVGYVNILGPVYTANKFISLQNCRKDIDNVIDQKKQYISKGDYKFSSDCNGKKQKCMFKAEFTNLKTQYNRISLTYQCLNSTLQIGLIKIQRNHLLYIAIIFDLIITVTISIFIWSEIIAENRQQKFFKERQFSLDSFSFQIGPFSKKYFYQQLSQFLLYIEGKNNLNFKISRKNIVQIRLSDDPQFVIHQYKKKKIYKKLYQFIGKYFLKDGYNPYKYLNQRDFIQNKFQNQNEYKRYSNTLNKLINQYNICHQLTGTEFQNYFNLIIVFEKPKYKRIIFQNSNMGKIKINNINYQLKQIVAPYLVIWQNINKMNIFRFMISWTLTFVCMLGSYILLAYILSLKGKTMRNYNFDVDCFSIYNKQKLNFYDENLHKIDQTATYLHCYCQNHAFLSINTEALCSDWSARYFQYLMVPLLYSCTVVTLNVIISFIYKKLSQYQAYKTLTSQLYSYIIKKTLLLILLLGMIIVILSFNQNQQSDAFYFLYEGIYNDITVDWYQHVGIIIIITLTINILTPIIQIFLYFLKRLYLKFKIWTFRKSANYKQLKARYIKFYQIDVFPIEQRYAQFLAVSTICLALSCVYPFMIIILIVQLALFTLIDKILIIKAYQKPINFQQKLHKKVIYSFLVAILIHLIITALLLTQKFIHVAGHRTNNLSLMQYQSNRIQAIFGTGYIIPYIIIFFLFLISLIVVGISHLYYISKPTNRLNIGKDGIPFEQHKFYNLLNSSQLQKSIILKQRQWQRMKILQEKYFKIPKYLIENMKQDVISEQIDTAQRMISIPTFQTKIFNSSQMLTSSQNQLREFSDTKMSSNNIQRNYLNSANAQKVNSNNQDARRDQLIIRKIIKNSLQKLLQKKQKNKQDRLRQTRLFGMMTYQYPEEWIFCQNTNNIQYKIKGIS